MMTIRQAVADDTPTVYAILHVASTWLHDRGYDQWPDGSPSLSYDRILRQIGEGGTYLISDDSDPIATIAVSPKGDPDFWEPTELAESAAYISKAAIVRSRAGTGLGSLILRWVVDQASDEGAVWARLDAWRTNHELHNYYRAQGWTYLRTVEALHRRSGALFQKAAQPDIEARSALERRDLPAYLRRPPLSPGSPVIVSTPDGPVAATVVELRTHDWSTQGWKHVEDADPSVDYVVARQGKQWTPTLIWPDPARG